VNAWVQHTPALIRALADPALRAIVLTGIVASAIAVFRVKHVSAQLMLWKGVLYASLLLPVLGLVLPPLSVRVPAARLNGAMGTAEREWQVVSKLLAPAPAALEAGPPVAQPRTAGAIEDRPLVVLTQARLSAPAKRVRAASAGTSVEVGSIAGPPAEPRPRAKSGRRFLPALRPALTTPFVIAIYLAGLAFLLGRLVVGLALSHRLRRQSSAITDPRALRWLKWHALAMGLERTPLLAESESVAVPLTFGVLRPVLLVPKDWRTWESGKLAAVIAHELSHVNRNDSLTRTLSLLYRSLFWFSPLSWWLERRLADLAEQASDTAALSAGAEPAYYAEVLMSFFNVANAQRRVNWQGVSMARGLRAKRRIDNVLAWKPRVSGKLRAPLLIALAFFALPLVLLTAATRPLLVQGGTIATSLQATTDRQLPAPPPPQAPEAPEPPDAAPPPPAALSPAVARAGAPPGPAAAEPAPPDAPPPPASPAPRALPTPPAGPVPPPAPPRFRLPVYPGAALAPDNDEHTGTVNLVKTTTVVDLAAARYVSNDSPDKILGYYRDEMADYGPVIECHGGKAAARAYVELDEEALENPARCWPEEIGAGETELKVADGVERIVAVKPHASGSEFALVTVQPATSATLDGSVAPMAAVSPAVTAAPVAAVRYAVRAQQAEAGHSMRYAVRAQRAEASNSASTSTTSWTQDEVQNDDENWTFNRRNGGMEFAIVSGKSVNINGSSDDEDEVRSLQKKIPGDFIWFIHNGDSYVIRDAGVVRSAKLLYAPMEELGRKQEALGKQQEELGRQQEALGKTQDAVRVNVPADLEAHLKKVQDELHRLGSNATQDDLGRLQGELGDLQGELGALQGKAGDQQGEIGRRQGELGEKQGDLGEKQGELGREQGRIARQASRQMQDILRNALAKGQAQRAPQ
jgi:beta-lactamase regulating signal transducer with metallopeptidase domain